jgi:hypothetical protein
MSDQNQSTDNPTPEENKDQAQQEVPAVQPNPEEWAEQLSEQEVTPGPENIQIYHDPQWKPADDPRTEADEANEQEENKSSE